MTSTAAPSQNSCLSVLLKAALIIAVCFGAMSFLITRWLDAATLVQCRFDGDGLRVGKSRDKAFVLTHIRVGSTFGALEPPLVRVESGSIVLTGERLRKLKWFDERGEQVSAPQDFTNARAIYFYPETTIKRESSEE